MRIRIRSLSLYNVIIVGLLLGIVLTCIYRFIESKGQYFNYFSLRFSYPAHASYGYLTDANYKPLQVFNYYFGFEPKRLRAAEAIAKVLWRGPKGCMPERNIYGLKYVYYSYYDYVYALYHTMNGPLYLVDKKEFAESP